MVKIGHASISELGSINGKPGDSTKKEVYIRDWYYKNWTHVLRCTNDRIAKEIARNMILACKNDYIGYGQSDRTTAYNMYLIYGDIEHIAKYCNADCSSLVALCAIVAGVDVSPYMTTWNEVEEFRRAGFKIYNDSQHCKTSAILFPGDILRSDTHTAIVVSADDNTQTIEPPQKVVATQVAYNYENASYNVGTFRTICVLNMRDGAGTDFKIMYEMPQNQIVHAYGYYNVDAQGVKWLYCQTVVDGTLLTGYCSSLFLEKI